MYHTTATGSKATNIQWIMSLDKPSPQAFAPQHEYSMADGGDSFDASAVYEQPERADAGYRLCAVSAQPADYALLSGDRKRDSEAFASEEQWRTGNALSPGSAVSATATGYEIVDGAQQLYSDADTHLTEPMYAAVISGNATRPERRPTLFSPASRRIADTLAPDEEA